LALVDDETASVSSSRLALDPAARATRPTGLLPRAASPLGVNLRRMKRYLPLVLLALLAVVAAPAAEQHVVSPAELEQTLEDAAETRRNNEADLQQLIANEEVQKAAQSAGIDPEQVRVAVPQLDDETLADLAERARELEDDVAGGFLGGIVIILVLVLLLAVLISVYVLD